jgi:hypothetical protein
MAYLWRASGGSEAKVKEVMEGRCITRLVRGQKRKEDVSERPIVCGRIDRLRRPARKRKRLA